MNEHAASESSRPVLRYVNWEEEGLLGGPEGGEMDNDPGHEAPAPAPAPTLAPDPAPEPPSVESIAVEPVKADAVADVEGPISSDFPSVAPGTGKPKKPRKPKLVPPDPAEVTDVWLARRFAEHYSGRLRYCPAKGWLEYNGGRWVKDGMKAPERLVHESIQRLREFLPHIKDSSKKDFERMIFRHESNRSAKATLAVACSDSRFLVDPGTLDKQPHLFNCQNGTIDLTTGELRPHDPNDWLTQISPVHYVKDATCPKWLRFLGRIMSDDLETISFIQKAAGYALSGGVEKQCFFVFHADGGNGKSVILNTLLGVMGDYGMTAPGNIFEACLGTKHSTDIADLEGKRLAAVFDPKVGRIDDAMIKRLTGGDAIRARGLYKDNHEFIPTHKFFISTNPPLDIQDTTHGMRRRDHTITLKVTISDDERIDGLWDVLIREEAPGILAWAVQGYLEMQTQGLKQSAAIKEATSQAHDARDPIGVWIRERCIAGPGLSAKTRDLHADYLEWGKKLDPPAWASEKAFALALEGKGLESKKTGGVMRRQKIALKPDAGQDGGKTDEQPDTADVSREGSGDDPGRDQPGVPATQGPV